MTPNQEKGIKVIQEFVDRLEDVRYFHDIQADQGHLMSPVHDCYEKVIADTMTFLKALQGKVSVG